MRWIAAMAISAALAGLGIAPASAHSQLIATSPADNSSVTAPPADVRFTFNEDLLDLSTVAIIDDAGSVVTSASVTPNGNEIVLPWPAELTRGTWQVSYRVVSADGHPVSGAITFSIGEGPPVQAEEAPSTSDGGVTLWLVGAAGAVLIAGVLVVAWRRRSLQ
jgi:methionine-rich copper-binding protein CopC